MADEAEDVEGEVQDAPDFDEVLRDIVGLTQVQVNRMEIQGIESVEDMILIGQEDTLDIFDAAAHRLTAMVKSRLKAFMGWAQYQEQLHGPGNYNLADFDDEECGRWQRQLNNKRKHDDKSKTKKDSIKMPETFNGKQQSWIKSKREMIAYLGQQEGVTGIPLVYVIWNEDDNDEEQESQIMLLIQNAVREGADFQKDNYTVFGILQLWTSGGTAAEYIDQFQAIHDGRSAWLHGYLWNL